MIVVGGGATGVGVAIDAATRGYDVLLLEQSDFGKGTSSRSTKLVHGGVRYLEQGNLSLVMEALKERGLLLQNAPHLVRNLGFVVPNYDWWEAPFYGIGLKLYNLLAGKYGFGTSRILSSEETLERLPTIKTEGLRGGVIYFDGQFDDSRLLINLVATACEQGATLLNYAEVTRADEGRRRLRGRRPLPRRGDRRGIRSARQGGDQRHRPFHRRPAAHGRPGGGADDRAQPGHPPGVRRIVSGGRQRHHGAAHQRRARDVRHPVARPHGGGHHRHADCARPRWNRWRWSRRSSSSCRRRRSISTRKPTRADVLSVFAGIRPLVRSGESGNTAALSRDHTIHIENSGMITICGGKWTTYRHMAEDCVNQAATLARLPEKPCVTGHLNIHGFHPASEKFGHLWVYGSDAPDGAGAGAERPGSGPSRWMRALPYTGAEVVWAVRHEMARTRGGRAGAAHAGVVPECEGGAAHGAARGGADGAGIGPRRRVAVPAIGSVRRSGEGLRIELRASPASSNFPS